MIKEVIYKNKVYFVSQPGELVYSKTKKISARSKFYQILDQLNNLSEIKGYSRIKYLKDTYNLTELEFIKKLSHSLNIKLNDCKLY